MNVNHTLQTAARVDATLRLGVGLTFEPFGDGYQGPVTVRFRDGHLLGTIATSQARVFAQRFGYARVHDNRGATVYMVLVGGLLGCVLARCGDED